MLGEGKGLMRDMRRQLGKINFLVLGLAMMVIMFVAALALAKESLESTGVRFMDALARHDVEKLVELSYIGETDVTKIDARKKRLREEWDFSVNTAGKYFSFAWRVTSGTKSSEKSGAVTVQVIRNLKGGSVGGYEEKFELPMEFEDGKWKVEVGAINRDMFPALPR